MRSRTPRWIRRAMLAAIALPALADDLVEPVSSPVAPPAVGPIETVELPVRWPLAEREAFRSALAAAQQARRAQRDVRGLRLDEATSPLIGLGLGFVPPLAGEHTLGSPFGWRHNPITTHRQLHKGVDVPCDAGEAVRAVADGVVRYSLFSGEAGHYVHLVHPVEGARAETRYLHLSRRSVVYGERVRAGDVIGRCGDSGRSTTPHLHFEVLVDGRPVPPVTRPVAEPPRAPVAQATAERLVVAGRAPWRVRGLTGEVSDLDGARLRGTGEVWVYAPPEATDVEVVVLTPAESVEGVVARRRLAEVADGSGIAIAVVRPPGGAAVSPSRWLGEVAVPWIGRRVGRVVSVVDPAPGAPTLGALHGAYGADWPAPARAPGATAG